MPARVKIAEVSRVNDEVNLLCLACLQINLFKALELLGRTVYGCLRVAI